MSRGALLPAPCPLNEALIIINNLGGGETHNTDFTDKSNFKKPGEHRPLASTHLV